LSATLVVGYLCDTSPYPGPTIRIRIEREGFEPAPRQPAIVPGSVEVLEVHLEVEGGTQASWSPCVVAGEADTCADVCGAEALMCTAASCDTADAKWPLASLQTFDAPECLGAALESLATPCDEPLPPAGGEIVALRCCCT
jgi:hypothetical protein